MLCKAENRDPEHCLKEGRRVTRCAIDLCVYLLCGFSVRDTHGPTHSTLARIPGSRRCARAAQQSLSSIGTVLRSTTKYALRTVYMI